MVGSDISEKLIGGPDDDTLFGAGGDDSLDGNGGNDVLDGGDGMDLAYYDTTSADPEVTGPVHADLATGLATGAAGNDTLVSIEILTGTGFDDWLGGNAEENILNGRNGHDTVVGGAGNDWLFGDNGDDILAGGEGDDHLSASFGNDTVVGGAGNDTLDSFNLDDVAVYSGNLADYVFTYRSLFGETHLVDQVAGRDGDDVVGDVGYFQFADVTLSVAEMHARGSFKYLGDADDSYPGTRIGDWIYGGAGADTLLGAGGNDYIEGGAGDDSIGGEGGYDTLVGGAGNDTLSGGSTIDVVRYEGPEARYSVVTVGGVSTITDLSGADGTDTAAFERIEFADHAYAYDWGASGDLEGLLKLLGALFGSEAATDPVLLGIGMTVWSAHYDEYRVAAFATDLLFAGWSDEAFVAHLYRNVTGVEPSAEEVAFFAGWDTDRGTLLVIAGEQDVNELRIGLAGLRGTGLEYVPF